MPTYTTNYHLAKPLVNSAVDQDLWGGELNDDMDTIDTTMKSLQDQVTAAITAAQLPIGSLYWNKAVATNPSSLLGYGTWVAITDKFVVARGSTYTATGGAAEVTLASGNLPSFAVTAKMPNSGFTFESSSTAFGVAGTSNSTIVNNTALLSFTGSSTPFSIIPTYQAAYCWERTA